VFPFYRSLLTSLCKDFTKETYPQTQNVKMVPIGSVPIPGRRTVRDLARGRSLVYSFRIQKRHFVGSHELKTLHELGNSELISRFSKKRTSIHYTLFR